MVDVQTEIIIDKACETVATYAANPEHAPEWYVNIKSAIWKTMKPLRVGSQIAFHAQFLGRQLAYTYEIVELIPNQKLVMRTAEGPFPMETTYTWTAINENQTRMTLRNAGQPAGFSKVFAPMMASMMRKANQKDLKNIKRILEEKHIGIVAQRNIDLTHSHIENIENIENPSLCVLLCLCVDVRYDWLEGTTLSLQDLNDHLIRLILG